MQAAVSGKYFLEKGLTKFNSTVSSRSTLVVAVSAVDRRWWQQCQQSVDAGGGSVSSPSTLAVAVSAVGRHWSWLLCNEHIIAVNVVSDWLPVASSSVSASTAGGYMSVDWRQ